ncbi:RiPP maturation radical SAM C-methyltransferase [Streptomyces sp. AM2-3-1]|uniref:RiPP maturation radical SAM C-methyltransferase n=1 Tax=Streptomyces sp. AM2-3-1 TaxID=3075824 RepID=UPI0028C3C460|nr:RiPP maturation radical SAM C-methyltransferase [Streptomyces sp. AM2-3-1]WNO67453.1 RiPP maturation radical SAM C-methyltransferase [Streptomyces sp. AM2-3-1]
MISVTEVRQSSKLRVLLVCMPWASLDMPSLALSTLLPIAADSDAVESVAVHYANLPWADYVQAESEGRIGAQDYDDIARGDNLAVGEWVFSSALYGLEEPEETAFHRAMSSQGVDLAVPSEMYRLAPRFVRELARTVVEDGYDVVGLTSTFDQNIPSLALAQEIKKLNGGVQTVLGGANCDGVQGAALHRNFPFLDYVVRGEAELVLPKLLRSLAADRWAERDDAGRRTELSKINGLCWRSEDDASVPNRLGHTMVPMAKVPAPDFSSYFDAFATTDVARDLHPKVQVEGGRGCWWGEKHHCTFCGLNGSLMTHRSKPAERVFEEIKDAVERHRVLDIVFADNILDMGYLKTLMPSLGELGWDLRMFFEVKSNLTYAQLRNLADAGVTQIQPGIENLSSRVLQLMRKGVTGWQNIRLLRDCRTLAIWPGWNLLYGFPGETAQDYEPLLDQLEHLVHLFPPERIMPIMLTRFSPYFDDPELGMVNQGPSKLLSTVYRLPDQELEELVYVFDSVKAGIPHDLAVRLEKGIDSWKRVHAGARLVAMEEGSGLRIVDERRDQPREFTLSNPWHVVAYKALLKGRSFKALGDRLRDADVHPGDDAVRELLDSWYGSGLVFRDQDHHVALATGLEYA